MVVMTSSWVMPRHSSAPLRSVQAKHVLAHAGPAAGFFPDLARMDGGQVTGTPGRSVSISWRMMADDLVDGPVTKDRGTSRCRRQAGGRNRRAAAACGWPLQRQCRSFTEGGDKESGPALHEKPSRPWALASFIFYRTCLCAPGDTPCSLFGSHCSVRDRRT